MPFSTASTPIMLCSLTLSPCPKERSALPARRPGHKPGTGSRPARAQPESPWRGLRPAEPCPMSSRVSAARCGSPRAAPHLSAGAAPLQAGPPAPAIRGARRSHLGDFPPFGHGHLWQLLLPLLFKKSEIWLVCGARSVLWPLCRGLALCPRPPRARHDPEPRPPRARVAWHSHWPGPSLRRRGLMCVSVSRPSPAFRPGPSLALGAGVQPATAQT